MNAQPLDRREFLSTVGRCAGGTCVACAIGSMGDTAWAAAPKGPGREVDFYSELPDGRLQCEVCPNLQRLAEGETGCCRTRTNIGGKLIARAYGNPCVLRLDPVEKLPLNHFRPGTKALTLALGGCNLRCLYCQNWQQSQSDPEDIKTFDLTPRGAVAAARRQKVDTIAFGYTEPIAYIEFATDVARAAKKAGLKVIAATGGYVNPEPLLDFAQYVDAFTIGLKGFTEEFYAEVVTGSLEPVLTAIETLKSKTKCWVEIVNLIVPTYNDDIATIRKMADWVFMHAGPDVPLHFERFVPMYKLKNLPRTSVQTLEAARAAGKAAGLRHVYTSNIAPHAGTNTYCDQCGKPAIERLGFKILKDNLRRGTCRECHHTLPGVW